MCIENLAEITLAPGLPVRGRLHVKAHVRELGREGGRDQHRVLIGIREELFGEAIFVVSAVDGEGWNAGSEPRDAVLTVARLVDWPPPSPACHAAHPLHRSTTNPWTQHLP